MAINVKIKSIYNFSTRSAAILGNAFKNMKVKSIMDFQEAVKYRDVATLHSTVKPTITGNPTVPDDVKDLTFILFETVDGENVVLAQEYIDESTVTEVKVVNIRAEVTGASTADINLIKQKLEEIGFPNATVASY